MEIARLVLYAVGTALSVFGFTFGVFQRWRKTQDDKMDGIATELKKELAEEADARKESVGRIHERIDKVSHELAQSIEGRMSKIEGKLDGMARTLGKIEDWFIQNPPRGRP